ncbi:hypothetical protein [Nocardioides sp.]
MPHELASGAGRAASGSGRLATT